MELSDFISLIGILIAIIAFLNESERKFIKNKFSKLDLLIILFYFLLINFLFYYNWWSEKIEFLQHFEHSNLPYPKTWTYLISLLIFVWITYKIFYARFPNSNKKKVLNFYQYLINKKDFHTLYSYINKYNKKGLLSLTNNEFENQILDKFISNFNFLEETATYNYHFIVQIINKNKINNGVFIERFIKSQIRNNSFVLSNYQSTEQLSSFYKLLENNKNTFQSAIEIYISNDFQIKKIVEIIFNYYLENKSTNMNTIDLLFIKLVSKNVIHSNNYLNIKTYLNIYYQKITEIQNSILFNILFENLTKEIFELKNDKNTINKFVDQSVILFNNSNRNSIKNSLMRMFDSDKTNKFRTEFYESWKSRYNKKDDFYNEIIKPASNY